MRKRIFTLSLISILWGNLLIAQSDPYYFYYRRLYFTGKVWGFLKYFHSQVAKGNLDWDSTLIQTLKDIKNCVSNTDFYYSLIKMIDTIPETATPTTSLPEVPDSLKHNLDLNWLQDQIFSGYVKARLNTIKDNFRPRYNYYVGESLTGDNPTFDTDDRFYLLGIGPYPEEQYRLLALFRYWNIINYFYPNKTMIDQNWDFVLYEFIPAMVNAEDALSYHLSFLELAARINDTGASTFSEVIDQYFGVYFLPLTLKFIENETVVVGVYNHHWKIRVGDIIKYIDGVHVNTIREDLKKYTAGSNDAAIDREINDRLLRGQEGTNVRLTVENTDGQRDVLLSREVWIEDYWDLIEETDDNWKILVTDSNRYGYVDIGKLIYYYVDLVFSELWDTDGIIFDIRDDPQKSTIGLMIRHLFDVPIHVANFLVPDIEYPGTLYWKPETLGTGDFSGTYDKNIFILFDEETQGQAEYAVMALEQHPMAVKIGSQTAGANGNLAQIHLPGGITTHFTAPGIFYPDYTETQRIGIIPDIEVHQTIAGIREGRDDVLEAALSHMSTNVTDSESLNRHQVPDDYELQSYPNPFNSSTLIEFEMERSNLATVKIYNPGGQNIRTLINGDLEAGEHKVKWDGRDDRNQEVGSGVYFVHLQTNKNIRINKILLVR